MTLTIISMPSRPGRARGSKGFVTDREASQAARLAGLDYRLSGRSAGSGRPAGVSVRLAGDQPADARRPDTRPKNARKRGRAGPTYVVGIGDERFDQPVLHRQYRKLMAGRK